MLFHSQDLSHHISPNTLIAVALYRQAPVKDMGGLQQTEEGSRMNRANRWKGTITVKLQSRPLNMKPFLSFSFPLVPLFPKWILRTLVLRDAQHQKGSLGKSGWEPLILHSFLEIPGSDDPIENSYTKKPIHRCKAQIHLTTGNSLNISWKHYRIPKGLYV